jgi:hypothetical protein
MTGKVYRALETPIVFTDSSGDEAITLQNLASGAIRVSDQHDRGTGSKPAKYRWRSVIQWSSTPTLATWAEIYIAGSDGTYVDGTVGTSDASVGSSTQLKNLLWIGNVIVQSASAATDMIASGECVIVDRYFSVVVYNRANIAFQNTANVSNVILTPAPDEIQV